MSQLCAMGSITIDAFTQSVVYCKIFGQGREDGRQDEAMPKTLRQLNLR